MAFVGKDNISDLIVLLHFEVFEDSHNTKSGRFRPLLMAGDHQSSKWDLFPIIFIRLFCRQRTAITFFTANGFVIKFLLPKCVIVLRLCKVPHSWFVSAQAFPHFDK